MLRGLHQKGRSQLSQTTHKFKAKYQGILVKVRIGIHSSSKIKEASIRTTHSTSKIWSKSMKTNKTSKMAKKRTCMVTRQMLKVSIKWMRSRKSWRTINRARVRKNCQRKITATDLGRNRFSKSMLITHSQVMWIMGHLMEHLMRKRKTLGLSSLKNITQRLWLTQKLSIRLWGTTVRYNACMLVAKRKSFSTME